MSTRPLSLSPSPPKRGLLGGVGVHEEFEAMLEHHGRPIPCVSLPRADY